MRLIHGDCREIITELQGAFSAVVTDPPYGVNLKRGDSRISTRIAGDLAPPEIAWVADFPAIVWGGNNFCDQLPRSTGWLVWDKAESPKSRHSQAEVAWCNVTRCIRVHKQAFRGFMATAAFDSDRCHPTQKPVKLMMWCLSFLPQDCTVIDPFMGSGSTGVACVRTGRNFIGIEVDKGYFRIARERIAAEKM